MITLSFNHDKGAKNASRGTQEQQIRDIIDTHLGFPGSDKLKMDVNIKENGEASVSFTGPDDLIAEARRLWQENVPPAAAKLKRAATKVKQATSRTAKSVKLKAAKLKTPKLKVVKKAAPKKKTASKSTPAKKAMKHVAARAKAKVSRKAPKKRKS